MVGKSWTFSLLFLCTAIAGPGGAPMHGSVPARVPLAYEAWPDGELIARQGPHQVTLTAGRITTTIMDVAAAQRASSRLHTETHQAFAGGVR